MEDFIKMSRALIKLSFLPIPLFLTPALFSFSINAPSCSINVCFQFFSGWRPVGWNTHELDFITDFDFITKFWRFPYNITTGAASQQRTLTLPDTWSCPIWDLHLFWCWDHSFLNLSFLRTFWVSNIPRYFYFAYKQTRTTHQLLFQIKENTVNII